jgi:cysteine synthase A
MKGIYQDVTQTIGSTPLVKINRLSPKNTTILVKLESFNPCGSVKDRIALSMIGAAENAGLVNESIVIVEPTSGNTGIGLACVCAARGYHLVLTMPESMSVERRKLLALLGAQIVLTPSELGMKGAVEKAEDLVRNNPNAFMPQQFNNPANPQIHRKTTAEEILTDTGGKFDYFVAGIGTGGTITGCGEIFKTRNKNIKIIGVEPADSAVLSGGKPGSHKIQGIGAGFVPNVLNKEILDEVIAVTNEDSINMARQLASQEGILAGISSGAALSAAIQIAKRDEAARKTIVVILPDTGERYISTEMYK